MKKLNGFTFTAVLKNKSRGIPITSRHCISNVIALQIQGWKWRFGSFIRNYNISKYQEKEKYAVIMHSHFSEFNHHAGTAMSRYIVNSTCVTTKLRENFKVTTFLSAFLFSFAINDNEVSAGKNNRKCHSIYLSRYSLRFG